MAPHEFDDRLTRVYNDVYFGNGALPGLTSRMKSSEERHEAMDERCAQQDKRMAGTENKFWAIILLLITILGGVIANAVKH